MCPSVSQYYRGCATRKQYLSNLDEECPAVAASRIATTTQVLGSCRFVDKIVIISRASCWPLRLLARIWMRTSLWTMSKLGWWISRLLPGWQLSHYIENAKPKLLKEAMNKIGGVDSLFKVVDWKFGSIVSQSANRPVSVFLVMNILFSTDKWLILSLVAKSSNAASLLL